MTDLLVADHLGDVLFIVRKLAAVEFGVPLTAVPYFGAGFSTTMEELKQALEPDAPPEPWFL